MISYLRTTQLLSCRVEESFYAPPNFSLTESPVLKPALPAVAPEVTVLLSPHPDVIVRPSLANEKIGYDCIFIAFFLVSSSHETFVKEYRWFFGGAIVESAIGCIMLQQ